MLPDNINAGVAYKFCGDDLGTGPTPGPCILHHNSKVPLPTIPGMGTSHPDCGKIQGWLWDRDGCGKTRVPLKKSCFRKECPICYKDWAYREGIRATERLVQAAKLNGYGFNQIRHIVFSPPQDQAEEIIKDKEAYKKARKELVKLMKEAGLKGGLVVFHPYRLTEEAYTKAKAEGYRSAWDMIRELPEEERTKYLRLSPHWHVNAVGFLVKSYEFYERTGWVYKVLGPVKTEKKIVNLIIYEIEHSALFDDWNLHNLIWFGCMSYNKVVVEDEKVYEEHIYCEHCGNPVHLFGCMKDGNIDVEADCGPYVQKRRVRVYRLNIKSTHEQGVLHDLDPGG